MSNDAADHGTPFTPVGGFVPVAQPFASASAAGEPSTELSGLAAGPLSVGGPQATLRPSPFPALEGLRLCQIDLKEGCYAISYTPSIRTRYEGALRVERRGATVTISGDLYRSSPRFPRPPALVKWPPQLFDPGDPFGPIARPSPISARGDDPADGSAIPIYPRKRYASYLRGVAIQQSPVLTVGDCRLTLTLEEFTYTQPAAGSSDGSFPNAPTRTVEVVLSPAAPPAGGGPYFAGTLFAAGAARGAFTLTWVSASFRRATVEIDTVQGSVAPQPVPAASGSGTEDLRTVFATAGWDATVIYNETSIPVPAGVSATACWSDAALHGLMTTHRNPGTDLDAEWRVHVLVVPGAMGCGRGKMYDGIGVPREGVVSYSDDGYPTSDSASFGTAANQKQRTIPRAFLRSCSHEVGHAFNQQHQEITSWGEAGRDNSIMTTSPGVADTLAGPTTGAPGVFPDQINLGFNEHIRHHLVHSPDPVIRPGGMSFGAGHDPALPGSPVDAGRYELAPDELALELKLAGERLKLGQPLELSFTLENRSPTMIPAPSDLRPQAQFAQILVTGPDGQTRRAPSPVVQTDAATVSDLAPDERREGAATVFWSSQGFAFTKPGGYEIEVRVAWNADGVPCLVRRSAELWVDYPTSDGDNEIASLLLHDDVGLFVALGGGATHLPAAVERIEAAVGHDAEHPAAVAMRGYEGHRHSTKKAAAARAKRNGRKRERVSAPAS